MKRKILQVLAIALLCSTACNEKQDQTKSSVRKEKDTTAVLTEKSKPEKPQTKEERIREIKAWYTKIQQIGLKNCSTKKRTKNDSFSPESEAIPFEQEASICKLNNDFEVISGTFYGYESGSIVRIYRKNGTIFFVLIQAGGEGYTQETRLYCDADERIILHLQREADNGDAPSGEHHEVRIEPGKRSVRRFLREEIKEIQWVLGRRI
jgi:hypothetical protein